MSRIRTIAVALAALLSAAPPVLAASADAGLVLAAGDPIPVESYYRGGFDRPYLAPPYYAQPRYRDPRGYDGPRQYYQPPPRVYYAPLPRHSAPPPSAFRYYGGPPGGSYRRY